MGWRCIGVPEELYRRVRRLAGRRGTAAWVVVAHALEFVERVAVRMGDVGDREFYLAAKVLVSLGRFLENPSGGNAEHLLRNLRALGAAGVDVELAVKLVEDYRRTGDKMDVRALREAVFRVVKEFLAGGVQAGGGGGASRTSQRPGA